MMKWLIPIAVASAATVYSCQQAHAFLPTVCSTVGPYGVACGGMTSNPGSRVIEVAPKAEDDSPEGIAARRAWERRCQPHTVTDDLGMRRWVYAEKGCEFGP